MCIRFLDAVRPPFTTENQAAIFRAFGIALVGVSKAAPDVAVFASARGG
jgi:hypothetical protein